MKYLARNYYFTIQIKKIRLGSRIWDMVLWNDPNCQSAYDYIWPLQVFNNQADILNCLFYLLFGQNLFSNLAIIGFSFLWLLMIAKMWFGNLKISWYKCIKISVYVACIKLANIFCNYLHSQLFFCYGVWSRDIWKKNVKHYHFSTFFESIINRKWCNLCR